MKQCMEIARRIRFTPNNKSGSKHVHKEKIPVLGAFMVPVKYGSQQKKLNGFIVKGGGPNLLGRDWPGLGKNLSDSQ